MPALAHLLDPGIVYNVLTGSIGVEPNAPAMTNDASQLAILPLLCGTDDGGAGSPATE